MSRYIDLEELERRIKENVPTSGDGNTPYEVDLLDWCKDECIRQGYAMPTADVVEVVRCRDCKFATEYCHGDFECRCPHTPWASDEYAIPCKSDDYCSYGERREECKPKK